MVAISKITAPGEIQQPRLQAQNEPARRADEDKKPTSAVAEEPRKVSEPDLHEKVQQLQESIEKATEGHHKVGFRVDHQTGVYVIEIKDKEGNLIKQLPAEKVLNLRRRLDELSGMVIDEMI